METKFGSRISTGPSLEKLVGYLIDILYDLLWSSSGY